MGTYVSEIPPARTTRREPGLAAAVLPAVVIALAAYLAISLQRPPVPASDAAGPGEFSTARAMEHLRAVARTPHPMGSAENHAVRDYILRELSAQGADAAVQSASVVHPSETMPYVGGTVQNVVGRLKGTGGGKAVLLMAHYDSAPTSPGAGDDGSAVAALLETARALKAGPPLRNDVIFLLTDGEEVGLLGAKAFVDEHPWAKEVGVVFNFEARGSRGPSIMFETSRGNDWLIREFARTSPDKFANSLSSEIYRRLPNDTDFTVTRGAGLPGLNFAYIGGLTDYHTVTDSVENIDPRSVQHQGSYALALARHFGGVDLDQAVEGDAVYFDLPGGFFVHYPAAWVLPLTALAAALFAGVFVLGLRRGHLTVRGVLFGLLALALSCVAANLVASLVWALVRSLHRDYESIPWGDTYNSGLYLLGFVFLTVATVAALYVWFRKRTSAANLTVGALLGWLLLAAASALLVPGGSYLLTWPLLFALAGAGLLFYLGEGKGWDASLVLAACAVPAVLLVVPMVYWLFVAMTVRAIGAVAVLLALLLGLLVPHLDALARPGRWLVPGAAALLCAAFLLAGLLTAGFDRRHPRMNQVLYGLNADTGRAVWASIDDAPDEWTAQFFPRPGGRAPLPELFPLAPMTFIEGEAPALPLEAPVASVVEDRADGGARTLRLRITSPRGAAVVSVYVESGGEVVGAAIDGKPVGGAPGGASRGPWGLQYHGLPEGGADLTLTLKPAQPVRLRVDDRTYQLPAAPGVSYRPRPENLMPMPSPYSDATLVSKSYTF